MQPARSLVLAALVPLLPLVLAACSGNAVVEPAQQSTKRAKAFIAKCNAPPPEDGTVVKTAYACIPAEDACPDRKDAATQTELGFVLEKSSACGPTTSLYDVPCGPDLNAIECCYVVRLTSSQGGCD